MVMKKTFEVILLQHCYCPFYCRVQASTLTAGPLARWPDRVFHLLWPVGPVALAVHWPERASDRQFGPQGVRSALARNVNQIWESNLRRCANQIWVVASICFLWFGRLRSSPGFPVSVTHPRIRANSSDIPCAFRSPSLCDRDRIMESLCFGSFREWHNVRARKFCRPRRPIVARGRGDWLSERGLFRIRFRNASLLLMLRLAKMFEKHSKHMEGNYWAPPDTSV